MRCDKKKKYDEVFLSRFWAKVERIDNEKCWEWQGAISSKGYGSVGIGKGKTESAHRVAYKIAYGDIPEGMHVLHHCDNRKCCNFKHLFLGTNKDNVDDMVKKGRQAKGEKNGRSKLTYKKVERIREIRKTENITYKQLAIRFGVSQITIRKIVKGDYWKLPLVE